MAWRPWRRDEVEPDGEFRRLAGRAIGWIYIAAGAITIAYSLSLRSHGTIVAVTMLVVGVGATLAGVVMNRLPWHRWRRSAAAWAVAPALGLNGLGNWVDPNPYLAGVFFFLVAMWVGTALPQGAMLALSPLWAVAYWFPLAIVPHAPGLEVSVVTFTAVAVVAGESLAWLTARLHRAQRRLREHDERRFQALLAASSDTTVVLDADGEATYVSPSAARVLGQPPEVLRGQPGLALIERTVHPEDAGTLRRSWERLCARPGATATIRFRIEHPDLTWHDVEGVGRNLLDDEAVRGILVNLRDVTERTELERALTRQAFEDQLTGLPNRRLLLDRAAQALLLAGRHGYTVALLLIDLNRFKEVNDTLGHHHGDLLLKQVAERLSGSLRASDTVARLGGDEFAVLLPHIGSFADAAAVAEKLGTAFEAPFLVEGLTLNVDASMGLAAYPEHASDHDELLRLADVAMYAAKAAHLDYLVYEPQLDKHSTRRLGLLGQVRRAIAEDELVLHYQPKVDVRTGRTIGVEALVRWQHPEYGLLGPGEFIPLAETSGLIRPLTSHVLELALRQLRRWRDRGHDLTISVNVSARCLLDIALPGEVGRLLEEAGVPPGQLVLEITESAIMTDPGRALEILCQLHALGLRLSIDDFGTGYSSMAYLKNMPVHELKVDRSFVTNMRGGQNERVIVRSTIDLGHNLGLQVVAEGVEDVETLHELEQLGCDIVQGYYVSRPMPAAQVADWLTGQSTEATVAA